MARQSFEVATEPHVAEIGDQEFAFVPELSTHGILEPFADLQKAYEGLDLGNPQAIDIARVRQISDAMRDLLSKIMLPDSAERFAGASIPDRTIAEMFRWIMEVYGGRPTTPSSDLPQLPSTNGIASTGASDSPDATTPLVGVSQGS